ncbi:MAG TPA: hemolysin III family protein [Acidimicrobiales bacterium]|nr:hemolysin III family protein [Acidimicrobiales bacterium]
MQKGASLEPQVRKPKLRGVSHEVAAVVFPILGVWPLILARSGGRRAAGAVYVMGVTGMYATSALYHRGNWIPAVRRRLRRLDHSMILVGIAATYTPVAGVGVGGTAGRVVLGLAWTFAAAGVVIRNLWLDAPRWVVAVVYLGVGWLAAAILPLLWTHLGVVTFFLVIGGGCVYSLGAVVFSRHRPDPAPDLFGYHEVFHALVLLAGLLFYAAVWRILVRA